jgi:N-acetylglutamate synthase-like GNAT family acetyltransferase
MIRRCTEGDIAEIEAIINAAAEAYRGVIPAECWHEPYMPRAQLAEEIEAGVSFAGWEEAGALQGVMGLQPVRDVTLIRHAYVRPGQQGRGIGGALLATLGRQVSGTLLVGTWAAAAWAIRFYARQGFQQVAEEEKTRLLQTYWTVPSRQQVSSVVLRR